MLNLVGLYECFDCCNRIHLSLQMKKEPPLLKKIGDLDRGYSVKFATRPLPTGFLSPVDILVCVKYAPIEPTCVQCVAD